MNQYWPHVRLLFTSVMVLVGFSTTCHGQDSRTVLVANFMNGNNAAFNSRVYLFKPWGGHRPRLYTTP